MITEGIIVETGNALSVLGWRVVPRRQRAQPPKVCLERYAWLPNDVIGFLCSFDAAVNPTDQAWLVTWRELSGQSDAAFSWNEWETMSLRAAEGNLRLQANIRIFWDAHFPILLSLKSRYGYIAIRKDLAIVGGDEPEFEETTPITDDFQSFLELLKGGTDRLDHWI